MSDLHYFVIKVSEDQVPRFKREVCYNFELTLCHECKYSNSCTQIVVREEEDGNVYCPVYYCSLGERKSE